MTLESYAKSLSFDLVGVADPYSKTLLSAPEGNKPHHYLPFVKSVISLGMKLNRQILNTTPSGVYSKHYDTLNEMLNSGAYRICKWLEDQNYPSMYFPETDSYEILWAQYNMGLEKFTPCFNHMAVAEASGLGKKGGCGVVLTPEYGPRQRWISILTEAQFEYGAPLEKSLCKTCGKCVDNCPVEAITSEGVDVRKCWINWTDLRKEGKACGICIKVCPVGVN